MFDIRLSSDLAVDSLDLIQIYALLVTPVADLSAGLFKLTKKVSRLTPNQLTKENSWLTPNQLIFSLI